MTDAADLDHITDKASYARISLPASEHQGTVASGSYFRLGEYVSDEASFLPANFLTTDVGTNNAPSQANASGLFLKTEGVLFMTVESGAYQSFEDVLSIHTKKELTLVSDSPASLTGSEVKVKSSDGNVSITSAGEINIRANGGAVTTVSNGNHTTKILGDKWSHCKGSWKSLAYGATFSAFLGSSIDLYSGDVIKNYGGAFITTAFLLARATLVGEFVYIIGWQVTKAKNFFRTTNANIDVNNANVRNNNFVVENNQMSTNNSLISKESKDMSFSDNGIVVENTDANIEQNQIKVFQ